MAASSSAPRFNASAPAVKRIMQEIREVEREGGCDLVAEALEDDIFQWFFAVRGAPGSDYTGGLYVGRVLLPPEYPLRPPSFVMLTPSGRFETGVKICLSISAFHEEDGLWSPSWSVRTALTALTPFMCTPAGGAIGGLDCDPADRRALAAASRVAPPRAGGGEGRQAAVERVWGRLKARVEADEAREAAAAAAGGGAEAAADGGDGLRQRHVAAGMAPPAAAAPAPPPAPAAPAAPAPPPPPATPPAREWEDALLTLLAALLVALIAGVLARGVVRAVGAGSVRSLGV